MENFIKCFIKSFLAGFLIGIGASTNLYLKTIGLNVTGSIMFTFGLIFICFFDLNLYTGKVGYFFDKDKEYKKEVLLVIFGNMIGASLFGFMMHFVKPFDFGAYKEFINLKVINFSSFDIFWLIKFFLNSVLAGILVYLAVIAFKKFTNPIMEVLGIVFSISIMVLLKGEHSIANIVYYSIFYDSIDHIGLITSFIICALGNGIGAILFNYLFKITNNKSSVNNELKNDQIN